MVPRAISVVRILRYEHAQPLLDGGQLQLQQPQLLNDLGLNEPQMTPSADTCSSMTECYRHTL